MEWRGMNYDCRRRLSNGRPGSADRRRQRSGSPRQQEDQAVSTPGLLPNQLHHRRKNIASSTVLSPTLGAWPADARLDVGTDTGVTGAAGVDTDAAPVEVVEAEQPGPR
ncbi:UNVERIFIED_CONTAM: hypothetical protein K2H54_011304, partial [Gekko kuhli]